MTTDFPVRRHRESRRPGRQPSASGSWPSRPSRWCSPTASPATIRTSRDHLQARYYDANIGRFTQPDPSGQEQNPYLYAEGDPVNRIDPAGLFSWSDTLEIGDDIFGVVTGCLSGIGAASTSGMLEAAIAVGPEGTAVAAVVSCAVGRSAGYYSADILTYE
ncbi:RHS repeat-associated core domain-containing protein [Streptomyces fagopyri]|uniref:RHS repeat-associated core domain-containing protein n=1 Tax=Streptomyces fagopyri TaxID=2662397 RepID=UPI003694C5A3